MRYRIIKEPPSTNYPWMIGFDSAFYAAFNSDPNQKRTSQQLLAQVGIRQCTTDFCGEGAVCTDTLRTHLEVEGFSRSNIPNLDLYIDGVDAAASILTVNGEVSHV